MARLLSFKHVKKILRTVITSVYSNQVSVGYVYFKIAVTWLKYCWYSIKLYPINQSKLSISQCILLETLITFCLKFKIWWVFFRSDCLFFSRIVKSYYKGFVSCPDPVTCLWIKFCLNKKNQFIMSSVRFSDDTSLRHF